MNGLFFRIGNRVLKVTIHILSTRAHPIFNDFDGGLQWVETPTSKSVGIQNARRFEWTVGRTERYRNGPAVDNFQTTGRMQFTTRGCVGLKFTPEMNLVWRPRPSSSIPASCSNWRSKGSVYEDNEWTATSFRYANAKTFLRSPFALSEGYRKFNGIQEPPAACILVSHTLGS